VIRPVTYSTRAGRIAERNRNIVERVIIGAGSRARIATISLFSSPPGPFLMGRDAKRRTRTHTHTHTHTHPIQISSPSEYPVRGFWLEFYYERAPLLSRDVRKPSAQSSCSWPTRRRRGEQRTPECFRTCVRRVRLTPRASERTIARTSVLFVPKSRATGH